MATRELIEAAFKSCSLDYTWFATYTDKAGKSFKSDFEKQVVTTPEPGIGALMLAGIGFLW